MVVQGTENLWNVWQNKANKNVDIKEKDKRKRTREPGEQQCMYKYNTYQIK